MKYIFDLEADNLLDSVSTIHCIVLRELGGKKIHTFSGNSLKDSLELLENADLIIGHNLIGYDLPVLKKIWNWSYEGEVFDTLVCSRTIWPNLAQIDSQFNQIHQQYWGSHSLKAWGYRLGEQKGDFALDDHSFDVFTPEMLDYCVQDTKVTECVYDKILSKKFSADALALEHRMATEMFKQEQRGFCFDVQAASSLFGELSQKKADIEVRLQSVFKPTVLQLKTKTKEIPFNPASRLQIGDRLRTLGWIPTEFTESGQARIDELILSNINLEEAGLLSEYLMLNKRIGQLATGKQAWLRLERKGKIHGRVNHMGCVSSRASHSTPNIAQVPNVSAPFGKECRSLFTTPAGYRLVGADASGLELRCLAHAMAAIDQGAYARELLNGDIHTVNQLAAGLPSRALAKTFIYAFLYSAGDERIGKIIDGGPKEGAQIKKKFLAKVPALRTLKKNVGIAAKRGWIKGLDGRRIPIRHEHAALNTLLQSAGAIICKRWYVEIEDSLRAHGYTEDEAAIVAFVHDEVQIQVKSGLENEIGNLAVRAIQKVESIYKFRCPLAAEFTSGSNWAETH